MLRPGESYLSVNWLEHTGGASRTKQLELVREQLISKGMTLPAHGVLAVLHLESMFDYIEARTPDSRRLAAHHEPDLPHVPSHSGIYGYRDDEDMIADLIAESAQDIHKARA